MFENKERELKLLITKEQYEILKESLPFSETREQINTYYDTPDGKLKKAGGALRIRQVQGQNILTLKLPFDAITKQEYEIPVQAAVLEDLTSDEQQFIQDHFPCQESFQKLTTFSTLRSIWKMADAELCLDLNTFGPFQDYELEYEYSKDHDGIQTLNKLLEPYGLHFSKNSPSKLARAISYSSNL